MCLTPRRWDSETATLELAVEDFTPREQDLVGVGLSVFSVDDVKEAREIGTLFALTCVGPGGSRGCVVFDPETAIPNSCTLEKTDVPGLIPTLREAHWEIGGLDSMTNAVSLTRAIWDKRKDSFFRITESEIANHALTMLAKEDSGSCTASDQRLEHFLHPRWRKELARRQEAKKLREAEGGAA